MTSIGELTDDLTKREWEPGPSGTKGVTMKMLSARDFTPSLVAAIARMAPGGEFPVHTHDYLHVFYVLKGNGLFTIGTETVRGAAGTVVRVPAEMPNGFKNPGPDDLHLLVLNCYPARH